MCFFILSHGESLWLCLALCKYSSVICEWQEYYQAKVTVFTISESKELPVVCLEAGKCLGSIMKSYLSKTQLHSVHGSLIDTSWYFSLEICLCMKVCCLDLNQHDRFQLSHSSVLDMRLPLPVASASSRYGGGFELLDSNLLLPVYFKC